MSDRIELRGGPADGWRVPSDMRQGKRVRVHVMPERNLAGTLSAADYWVYPPSPVAAFYDMIDNESGAAKFVGMEGDKLPSTPEEDALCDALANASNDDILTLMRQMQQVEKRSR